MAKEQDIVPLFSFSRTLALVGEIDDATVGQLIAKLLELDSRSKRPIRLIIHAEGGCVEGALALYDCIRSLRSEVVGVVMGTAYSSALLVLQACDKRLITENSAVMMHAGQCSTGRVSPMEMVNTSSFYKEVMDNFERIVSSHSRVPEKCQRWFRDCKYFTAQEALEYGFVDGVYV